jgi:hypothetical protein
MPDDCDRLPRARYSALEPSRWLGRGANALAGSYGVMPEPVCFASMWGHVYPAWECFAGWWPGLLDEEQTGPRIRGGLRSAP